MFIILTGIFVVVVIAFLYFAIKEMISQCQNPAPLFCNGDKRFREIVEDKTLNYKMRSFLKDIKYDKK